MKNYLSTNSKLRKSGIFSWGIPAYRSSTGKLTCPGANDCIKGCYARAGFYVMPNVAASQEARLRLSETEAFINTIDSEIKRRKIKRLRIHDSGDFYSRSYLEKWQTIIAKNPGTLFYAYTKMLPLFKPNPGSGLRFQSQPNFIVIFSEGGKWDTLIKSTDRHSRVFESAAELKKAKYADAHVYDSAAFGKNHRIGLVYHGPASRNWTTA